MWKYIKSQFGKKTTIEDSKVIDPFVLTTDNVAPDQLSINNQVYRLRTYPIIKPIIDYINELETSFLHLELKNNTELADASISWIIYEFKKHLILMLIMKELPFYNRYMRVLWSSFKDSKAAKGYNSLFKTPMDSIPFVGNIEKSVAAIDSRSLYEAIYQLFFEIEIETVNVNQAFKVYVIPQYMRLDYMDSTNRYLINAYHRTDIAIPEFNSFLSDVIRYLTIACEELQQKINLHEEQLVQLYKESVQSKKELYSETQNETKQSRSKIEKNTTTQSNRATESLYPDMVAIDLSVGNDSFLNPFDLRNDHCSTSSAHTAHSRNSHHSSSSNNDNGDSGGYSGSSDSGSGDSSSSSSDSSD